MLAMPATRADSSSQSSSRWPMPMRRCDGRTASSTRCARSSPNSMMAKPATALRAVPDLPFSHATTASVSRSRIARITRAASYFQPRPDSMKSRDIVAIACASRGSAGRMAMARAVMRALCHEKMAAVLSMKPAAKPNFIVILVDDLRFDETGASGHPYMKTPNIDRLAAEGARFANAFHTTPLCSPNRASILTGQYASRHGIIDNVGRDAMSHRLPNYHLALQRLGYETAHIGKWHMGNDAAPRPGYDHWVSFRGQGLLADPVLWEDGKEREVRGYVTDLLNQRAVEFLERKREKPFALFLAHKAVHPDVQQKQDGTIDLASMRGYLLPERHENLYRDGVYPPRPNVMPPDKVVKEKPAWKEVFALRERPESRPFLEGLQSGTQEEIRRRAAMMASVDEGVGMILRQLEKTNTLDRTFILFLGDNGFFFGEHGLG